MIEHDIKKFVVRQKGFKDTPITFIGENGWWAGMLKFGHGCTTYHLKHKTEEPTRKDAYGAWANHASAIQLGSNGSKKPYVMEIKK